MKIVKMELSKLNEAEYNPRRELTDKEFNDLKASIQENGYLEPIVVNIKDGKNIVISGHQRLKVLKHLGIKEVDVSVVDLDKEQEQQLNIILNRVKGGWDPMKLANLFASIEDRWHLGFDKNEIDGLLTSAQSKLDELFQDATKPQDGADECTCPHCGRKGPKAIFAPWHSNEI